MGWFTLIRRRREEISVYPLKRVGIKILITGKKMFLIRNLSLIHSVVEIRDASYGAIDRLQK